MTKRKKNENVARHIWNDILQCSPVPFRWGFEFRTVKTIPSGTSFRINTTIVGLVKITSEQQDCFTVTIKPDNYGGSLVYDNITSQNLVSHIDQVIREGILADNRKSLTTKVVA